MTRAVIDVRFLEELKHPPKLTVRNSKDDFTINPAYTPVSETRS